MTSIANFNDPEFFRQLEIDAVTRTPSYLAQHVTENFSEKARRYRTRLWKLFDRVALALLAGSIVNAVVMCPPQHGKSEFWSKYFPAWWVGKNPEHRIVLGAYGAQFASGWGRATRDVIREYGPKYFGVSVREDVAAANEWKLAGHEGGMVTAGIDGGIAGRPADLGIADDIIADANSGESVVEKVKAWRWFEEEFSARLQKGGRRVVIMTRRAVDDPIGRILQLVEAGKEKWTVIRLPAIAEENENWPEWGWNRTMGEALIEELHPLDELRATELSKGPNAWAGLYQQRPYPRGGGDLKGEWFVVVEASPVCRREVRAWDLAASESPSAKRTAGMKIGQWRKEGEDFNRYHIEDAVAGRWAPGRRNAIILETAKLDGRDIDIVLEQEPGSGGIAQLEEIKRKLDGFRVYSVVASREGSKEQRADAMAAQAGLGNFTMKRAPWNLDFVQEANSFPAGLIDMIDAAAHGYNHLAGTPGPVRIPKGFTGLAAPGTRVFGTGRPS